MSVCLQYIAIFSLFDISDRDSNKWWQSWLSKRCRRKLSELNISQMSVHVELFWKAHLWSWWALRTHVSWWSCWTLQNKCRCFVQFSNATNKFDLIKFTAHCSGSVGSSKSFRLILFLNPAAQNYHVWIKKEAPLLYDWPLGQNQPTTTEWKVKQD